MNEREFLKSPSWIWVPILHSLVSAISIVVGLLLIPILAVDPEYIVPVFALLFLLNVMIFVFAISFGRRAVYRRFLLGQGDEGLRKEVLDSNVRDLTLWRSDLLRRVRSALRDRAPG